MFILIFIFTGNNDGISVFTYLYVIFFYVLHWPTVIIVSNPTTRTSVFPSGA